MIYRKLISLLCSALMTVAAVAQGRVDTRPHVFDENVRSLQVSLLSNRYIPAV